jgi:hypothetical protein
MNGSDRALNPKDEELARRTNTVTWAGADYYDDDLTKDLSGNIEGLKMPDLFRNVAWGPYTTNKSNDTEFPTSPTFRKLVPGRLARRPDGSIIDQKSKLVVKLTDAYGRKRIFTSPPPRDWRNERAISILNKRIAYQIRRSTEVERRAHWSEYTVVERTWIRDNLIAGQPPNGYTLLATEFNKRFADKILEKGTHPRPTRTRLALRREVVRYRPDFYSKGLVPMVFKKAKAVQEEAVQEEAVQEEAVQEEAVQEE